MKISAEYLIHELGLKPLPREGGYFAETYRASLLLPASLDSHG